MSFIHLPTISLPTKVIILEISILTLPRSYKLHETFWRRHLFQIFPSCTQFLPSHIHRHRKIHPPKLGSWKVTKRRVYIIRPKLREKWVGTLVILTSFFCFLWNDQEQCLHNPTCKKTMYPLGIRHACTWGKILAFEILSDNQIIIIWPFIVSK